MFYKSLLLGIVFSMGIFAVKSGVGLHYGLSRLPNTRRKVLFTALYSIGYLAMFLFLRQVLLHMDMMQHLSNFQTFIQSGMIIHVIMAALLALWGVHLLRHRADGDPGEGDAAPHGSGSRGWLLLVIPCPVCGVVIFLSLGFLRAAFPDSTMAATLMLFSGFLLINLCTIVLMAVGTKKHGAQPERVLGSTMLMIAAYFTLSVTIMPQFADVEQIYRISMASSHVPAQPVQHLFPLSVCLGTTFALGFTFKSIKIRRRS